MERPAAYQACALALLLAACSAPPAPPPAPPKPPEPALEGRVLFEAVPASPTIDEGAMTAIRFRIANRVEGKLLVLQEVSVERHGVPAARFSFQTPRPGRLDYDARTDAYALRAGAGLTEPVFNTGMLAPREETTFALSVRALASDWTARVSYFLVDPAAAAEHGYYLRDKAFVRVEPSVLSARFPKADGAKRAVSVVLFIPSIRLGEPASAESALRVKLIPREPSLPEARRRAGDLRLTGYTYSELLGGWVFQSAGATTLVTRDRVETLPPVATEVLDLLDLQGEPTIEIECRRGTYALIQDRAELVSDDGDPIAFVPRAEFRDLLRRLADARRNLRLDYRIEYGARDGRPVAALTY